METSVVRGSVAHTGPVPLDKIPTSLKEDSLRKRYIYKLFGNLFGLGIGVITQAIIPRGLGPKAYGDFNFLTNFFSQVVSFLEMGTGTAYYTKLSQRPGESSLVSFYCYVSVIISLLTIGSVLLPVITGTQAMLWPEQTLISVFLAAVFGILTWIVTILNSMADAYGITVRAEVSKIFQRIAGLLIIVIMFRLNILDLSTFFYYHYALLLLLGSILIGMMRRHASPWQWRLPLSEIKKYSREFYHYSHPLFMYSLIGLVTGLFDRWMLQTYSGSEEQGYYGLAFQVGALCFVFTGAMTPLFMRELSIAFGNRDSKGMADLFHRYIPLLYVIAAFFSCFMVVQADTVTYLFGGSKFSGAITAVAIMAIYPLHQTYGQLSGSVFLATGQTVIYKNIGLVMMMIGLPITYFILAPPSLGGLGIGANGLAVKMVVLNIVWVNIQLYYNARYLDISLKYYLRHQIVSAACLMVMALISTFAVERIVGFDRGITVFLLAGTLYTTLAVVFAYFFPGVFGLQKDDFRSLVQIFRERLSGSR